MTDRRYMTIVEHYEKCFSEHGPGHLGVDWPNARDADIRYATMLGVIDDDGDPISLLDFGCGSGGLFDYLERHRSEYESVRYQGHDISKAYVDYCRQTYPDVNFTCGDVLVDARLPRVDYAVANGVFTEKLTLSTDEMFEFLRDIVTVLYASVDRGLAFNVMSKKVDWERDDLFHLDAKRLRSFAVDELGASLELVEDYGLYEYTAYLRKPAVG